MTISLKIAGKIHAGWKSANVTRRITGVSGSFDLTVSERWPGQGEPVEIRPGDSCQVMVDGDAVITGYVDDVRPSYSATQHEVTIKGRSKTADLADCSIDHAGQFTGRTIDKIVSDLAAPFGITVITSADVGAPINEDVNQGETVWDLIEDLGLIRGVLIHDNAAGNLVISRTGAGRASAALVNAKGETNVLQGSATFSTAERFSLYVVKGQDKGTDFAYGDAAAGNEAREVDANISRYRPLVIVAEKAANLGYCQDRARWERSVRAGKSIQLEYTVQGWRQNSGALWSPNLLVDVRDDFLRVNGSFLISDVTWSISGSGQTTRLVCVPPDSFAPEPVQPSSAKAVEFWRQPSVAAGAE